MASFTGWGTAWGGSWGPTDADPNAMAGSASISVTATGALTAGTVEQAPVNGGGFFAFDRRPQKRKREAWQDELAKLLPVLGTADVVGPEVDAPVIESVPREDPGARQYIESLFANIERAKKDQQRAQLASRLAKAEKERKAAEFMLTQAIEAERQARQDVEEMDIVFIASVLANL